MIKDTFIQNIPSDFNSGVKYILDEIQDFHTKNGSKGVAVHDYYVEYCTLLESYLKSNNHPFKHPLLKSNKSLNIKNIISFYSLIRHEFEQRLTNDFVTNTRSKFEKLFDNGFYYSFTDGDLNRIQIIINELRDQLIESPMFTAEHKSRLLKRLESLQAELHKKMSDLDKFWGLVGDAGIAIGKFGNDAKPFVSRIKEITDIIWRTQANAEELPSGTTTPFLSSNITENN